MTDDDAEDTTLELSSRVPPAAAWLGVAGVVPFLGGLFVTWVADPVAAFTAVSAMIVYGAVILSFLGGIQWGFAVGRARQDAGGAVVARILVLGVLPCLVGLSAWFLAPAAGLLVMTMGFAGALILDFSAMRLGLAPGWWMRLRVPLTAAVIACLLLTLAAPPVLNVLS